MKRKGKRRQSTNEQWRMSRDKRKKDKKRGKAPLKIVSRRERRTREKERVMVVASPGNGRWLKNEVIW